MTVKDGSGTGTFFHLMDGGTLCFSMFGTSL